MNTKIIFKITTLVLVTALICVGCSLISGNSPTETIRNYHLRAESNNPEAMVKLFSSGYLEKNKKTLENCRSFADLVQKSIAARQYPSLFDLSETFVGEKAIVKGRYGLKVGGSLPFQARLIKENGGWKIETFTGDTTQDLTKEEPPIERSKELMREIETDGNPMGLVFSPDGKTLAYTAESNEAGATKHFIYLLDVPSGAVKSKIPVEAKYNIGNLRFSPDGKMIVATNGDKTIYIWDIGKTGAPKQTISFNETSKYENAVALAFAPNGSLYGGGSSGSLQIYDSNTGKLKQSLEGHPREAKATNTTNKTNVPPPPASGLLIYDIVFSTDGKLFATVSENEVKIWDTQTGKALKKLSLPAEIVKGITNSNMINVAFAPDGKSLLTYSRNGLLQSWNIQTGEATTVKELEKIYVGSADFSANGKLMTDSGGKSDEPPRGLKIYNTQTGELKATFSGHRGQARGVLSPDGKLAASMSDKDYSKIFLWDISGISQ